MDTVILWVLLSPVILIVVGQAFGFVALTGYILLWVGTHPIKSAILAIILSAPCWTKLMMDQERHMKLWVRVLGISFLMFMASGVILSILALFGVLPLPTFEHAY